MALVASAALPAGTDLSRWQVYKSPTSWSLALLVGATARIYSTHLAPLARRWPVALATAVLAVTSVAIPISGRPALLLTVVPLLAGASAVLVVAAANRMQVSQVERPLVMLGTISYGAYLWNGFLTEWWRPVGFSNLSIISGLALCAVTVGCATVSWFTAEHAGRLPRARYDSRQRSRQDGARGDAAARPQAWRPA